MFLVFEPVAAKVDTDNVQMDVVCGHRSAAGKGDDRDFQSALMLSLE